MKLGSFMDVDGLKSVRSRLSTAAFRRLADTPEVRIKPQLLCQALHFDRFTGNPRLLLGDSDAGYYMHSVESSMSSLEAWRTLGLSRIYLGPSLAANDKVLSYRQRLDCFVSMVQKIRQATGPDVELIVDPAGLCMESDLRWGIRRGDGSIDEEATLSLLGIATQEFGDAGADGVLTIGRMNCEVEVARAGASKSSRPISILSFSTNSETTSAYFETTRHDVARSRTGQKILVGNVNEMIVRSISDFGEGSNVIVQKPIEAFHALAILRLLASNQMSVAAFLEKTPGVPELLAKNSLIRPAIERGVAELQNGLRRLRTGTYEVSGTYSTIRLIAKNYSEELAWSMLDEIFHNAAAAAGGTLDIMISRSAAWYLHTRAQLDGRASAKSLALEGVGYGQ